MTYDFPVLLALILIVRFCVRSLRLNYPKPPEPSERNFDSGVSFDGGGPVVDTTKLVVGQDVYMVSGCYWNEGKVVKVTPSGADVQTGVMQNDGTWNAHELVHFDKNGRSYVTELPSSYDSTAHPLSPWGWDGNGTYECGPWYIDDMPFAERTAERTALREALHKALREQGTRRDMKTTLEIGQDVYVVSNGGYSRKSR
jgi:hypothetical protein